MGALEEGGKAIGVVAESMKSAPLALALLIVNTAFIAFSTYMMHEVAETVQRRNEQQTQLIKSIVDECLSRNKTSIYYRSSKGRLPIQLPADAPATDAPASDLQPKKLDQPAD